jgi:tetratricopeptide (TPR) repeat protein
MRRDALQLGWLVGIFALFVSTVSCGGSTSTQRDDNGASGGHDDVGDRDRNDDSDVHDDGGDGGGDAGSGGDGTLVAVNDGDEDANGGAAPAPTPRPAAPERTFKTSEKPEKMSEFLEKPAKQAVKDKEWALAVSLYRGLVAARGKAGDDALELAKAWNLAKQYEEAARVYEEFAAVTTDGEKRRDALQEVVRLRDFEDPFQRDFVANHATKEAKEAFSRGRKAQKKKKWGDALLYFEMAGALDPSLAGVIREIGTTYGRLGAKDEKLKFLLDYLWRSPMGPFSDEVRKDIKQMKKTKELGYLNVVSKLACEEVWVVGQRVTKKLPIKKLSLAPGRYKWLCFAGKYGMAYFKEVDIEAGKTATLEFYWAILVNALENPWGRIVIEDARAKGVLRDVGIQVTEYGIIVPADGSALQMQLKGPTGAVLETRFPRIATGTREVVKWSK